VLIAFTNETLPTLDPMLIPNYVHVFPLSVVIWITPKMQIMPQNIYDSLQAGEEYDYEIRLKNIGKEPININPKMSNDNPYGPIPAAFKDDARLCKNYFFIMPGLPNKTRFLSDILCSKKK
jgi:hypothetical protein